MVGILDPSTINILPYLAEKLRILPAGYLGESLVPTSVAFCSSTCNHSTILMCTSFQVFAVSFKEKLITLITICNSHFQGRICWGERIRIADVEVEPQKQQQILILSVWILTPKTPKWLSNIARLRHNNKKTSFHMSKNLPKDLEFYFFYQKKGHLSPKHTDVFKNRGTPKWMVYNGSKPY